MLIQYYVVRSRVTVPEYVQQCTSLFIITVRKSTEYHDLHKEYRMRLMILFCSFTSIFNLGSIYHHLEVRCAQGESEKHCLGSVVCSTYL
jgi:hypothetical protein